MTFTETFGGTTIYPSDVSYRAISLSANVTLAWPLETATNGNVVAQIMDVTPSAGSFTITMPPANEASPGETALFFNAGSFNFTVADNAGNTIVSIAPGLAYQVYLRTNTTVAGQWRSTQFGAGTSTATAGSLVGAGIKAINTTLNQSMTVSSLSVNYTAGAADRSSAFLWTGGAGTITLPAASTVGNDWFFHIRNGGTGAISLATTGGELVNGTATVSFNPGDSAIIVCDGSGYFTIGFGQAPEFLFDYVSIDLTSQSSPYTISGSNLNRIAYQFSGVLTTNMVIIVPATIQQYWVGNSTTGGSYTLTVKTTAGTGVAITRDSRSILYCNGTDVVTADTGGIGLPILVSQGGTGATTPSGARTNLGATSIGNALFTAVDEATARNAIIAAKSGANSDITSLSGLTTPLSVPQGGSGVAALTANGVVLGNGASALAVTAVGTTGQVLVGNTGAAPTWATLTGIGVTSFSAGTTGLTPNTATTGAITLAGTLGVANGGTGVATLTANGVVLGNGASALAVTAVGTTGQVLVGNTGAAPTWSTLSGIGVTSFSAGTTGLTPSTATTGAITLAGTLGVANGGTGTGTAFTAGSVVFAGASGVYSQDNGELFWDNANNRLGIGTSLPQRPLHVFYDSATVGVYSMVLQGRVGGYAAGVSFQSQLTGGSLAEMARITAGGEALWNTTPTTQDAGMRFYTATAGSVTEKMCITRLGRVGIGTTEPSSNLHVNGTAVGAAIETRITNTSATGTTFVTFGDGTDIKGQIWVGNASYASFGGAGSMNYSANSGPHVWYTNYTERVRIGSDGNVGINEIAPDYKLDVNGTFGFTPGASVTPVDNGDVVFELTNNTTLTIKAKGSDGVVRSGTITLA